MEMLELDFMKRAFLAGLLVALTCPLIGILLVVKKQSLIGDGLGHIAFAGVSAGWFLNWQPVVSAALFTVVGAVIIEKMRSLHSEFTDMILAIFFYCGMALAIVFASLKGSGGVSLTSFLFGSIITVSETDLYIISIIAVLTIISITIFYRQFIYLSFDEEGAKISGLPVSRLNLLLSVLTALTIVVSMRIVGLLLVSAMMVIPVAVALSWKKSFGKTILIAIASAAFSVIVGLSISFYADLAPGGIIVISCVFLFLISEFICKSFIKR